MISLSDTELTDSRGRPLHGSALQGAREAAVRKREAELAEAGRHLADREAAMAAQRAVVRAQSRALLKLLARGGLSGPDALRSLVEDPEDAAVICESAGLDSRAVQARWSGAAPAAPAQSRSDFWSQFPEHHPDFLAGRRTLADVTAEHRAHAAEKAARRYSPVMWHTRDGEAVRDGGTAPLGVSLGPDGAPVQVSRVSESVPPLGSEG